MGKFFLILLFSISLTCFGATLSLKESLAKAEPGSYLVTQQGKNFDFLYIRDKTTTHLTLEEVAIPASNFDRTNLNWRTWFEQGAPGHTLWTVSQINLDSGDFEEFFSFTHQGWIDLSEEDSFFSTLLNLSFNELELQDRKKIGLPPGRNKPDYRSYWVPKVTYEGRTLNNVPFKAYKARWPHDKSELSDRLIEVYVPEGDVTCPSFFPFWVEVEGRIGNAKMRVIDSGKGLHSPRASYPKRPVSVTHGPTWTQQGLSFDVKASQLDPPLQVTAISEDKLIALPFPLSSREDRQADQRTITISHDTLKQWLEPGESYQFSIASVNAGSCSYQQLSTLS